MDTTHTTKTTWLERAIVATACGLLLTVLAGIGWLAWQTKGFTPAVAAPAAQSAPPAPLAPGPDPRAVGRAEAAELLGAAGSMRAAGDLGVAVELGRQAVAKSPDDAEARAFLQEVEAQKKAAEDAAAEQAYAAAHNGWSRAEQRRMGLTFYQSGHLSMLASACAEQNVLRTMSYADWQRWLRTDDLAVKRQVVDIIERCNANALDVPIR